RPADRVRTLETELRCCGQLGAAVRTARRQRSRTFQAELRAGRVLRLASGADHRARSSVERVQAKWVFISYRSRATAHRQRECKRRALSHLALPPDSPAMQLDELAGEGQPEAGPLDLLVRCPDLPELLEDRLLILGRDAGASVGHGHLHQPLAHGGPDIDAAALGGELER